MYTMLPGHVPPKKKTCSPAHGKQPSAASRYTVAGRLSGRISSSALVQKQGVAHLDLLGWHNNLEVS